MNLITRVPNETAIIMLISKGAVCKLKNKSEDYSVNITCKYNFQIGSTIAFENWELPLPISDPYIVSVLH